MKHMTLRNTLSAATIIVAAIVTTTALAEPAAQSVTLPQRVSATELKRMMMDLPDTFEIVDVRPVASYATHAYLRFSRI